MKIRSLINRALEPFGCALEWRNRRQPLPADLPEPSLYLHPDGSSRLLHPWEAPAFRAGLSEKILGHTMLSRQKLYLLRTLFDSVAPLDGDIFEAGTCSGGSALFLTEEADRRGWQKRFWLLDTFAGYQKIDPARDGKSVALNQCRGHSRAEVAALFSDSRQDVRLVEGLIPGTLAEVDAAAVCFAHVDVNLYEPTYAATRFVLERLCRGGLVVFDDYNWPATFAARQAIDAACREFGKPVLSLPGTTQALLVG